MAVNNQNPHEQVGDYRSRPRWPAGKKMENEILRAAAEKGAWDPAGEATQIAMASHVARGLALRHDGGPQYRSAHCTGSLAWLGITDSPAFLGEPETNGCAERWIRTSQGVERRTVQARR